MKIVVDDKIPFIRPALDVLADEVVAKSGRDITPDDVRDADILLVRTRTRCDRQLLQGSRVKLIVTATIGFDHLDTAYLHDAGIQWFNCPGCNADSVAQYVHACLILLKRERGLDIAHTTLGIVGVGHVGRAVLKAVRGMGFREILLNDPPLAEAGTAAPEGFAWSTLDELTDRCQVITLHTPLTAAPPHPTLHLFDRRRLAAMRPGAVLINAGRGEVVDNEALEAALEGGTPATAIIDTWEGEPDVRRTLLRKVFIGTPHVAGYSTDGKANATRMTLEQVCRFLGRPMTFDIQPPALPPTLRPADDPDERALQLYDPRRDSERLKAAPQDFEAIRGHYPLRREHF